MKSSCLQAAYFQIWKAQFIQELTLRDLRPLAYPYRLPTIFKSSRLWLRKFKFKNTVFPPDRTRNATFGQRHQRIHEHSSHSIFTYSLSSWEGGWFVWHKNFKTVQLKVSGTFFQQIILCYPSTQPRNGCSHYNKISSYQTTNRSTGSCAPETFSCHICTHKITVPLLSKLFEMAAQGPQQIRIIMTDMKRSISAITSKVNNRNPIRNAKTATMTKLYLIKYNAISSQ